MEKRNYSIDLGKYLAAICVIAIHTEPFVEYSEVLNTFVVQIVARMAVPYFAVCSGYFASKKSAEEDVRRNEIVGFFAAQWKKILFIYLFWSIIYLLYSIPKWAATGWLSLFAFADYGIATFRIGSHYHLWYLLGYLYAWPVFYLCMRYMRKSYWLWASLVLYVCEVIRYVYKIFLPEQIEEVFSVGDYFDGFFSGIFCILPFMLLGAFISKKSNEVKFQKTHLLDFLGCFLMLILEVIFLYNHGQKAVSYILFTYPVAYTLFRAVYWLKPVNEELCKKLGTISIFVYCFHPMCVEVLEALHISNLMRFFITAILSTMLGLLAEKIIYYIHRRRSRACFH